MIGSIEAVAIDGHLHYFAYSHSSDMVVSPLFSDAESMAEYAVPELTHRDGKHDLEYWMEMTRLAFDERWEVSSEQLTGLMASLEAAEHSGEPQPDMPRVGFLLNFVCQLDREIQPFLDWSPYENELSKLGLTADDMDSILVDNLLDHVAGKLEMFDKADVGAAAKLARIAMAATLKRADDTWRKPFEVLMGPTVSP
ncbi:MAG: hypothetical protein QNI99_12080 [Woeseiaceae bacterium]|nr:hypothetical protein [Woeseiaceae bacterium]